MYFDPCKCCSCIATEDDFNDNDLDTTKRWEVVRDTWAESGSELRGTGDHAIIKTQRLINGYAAIEAKVTTGNIARLILYFEDKGNYVCGQVDKVADELKIIRRTAGVDNQIAVETGVTVGTKTWRFCQSADNTLALYNVDDATENAVAIVQPAPAGSKPGALATAPSTTAAYFDDFKFFQPDGSEDCPDCEPDIAPQSCSELCGDSHPDEVTADITQEPTPDCYGGDQTGVTVPKFGTGDDTCEWLVEIWNNGFGSSIDLHIAISWTTRKVSATLSGIIGLGSGGNALFESAEGVINDDECNDFDVTCTRIGGSGLIGDCFGTGSTIRVYVSP